MRMQEVQLFYTRFNTSTARSDFRLKMQRGLQAEAAGDIACRKGSFAYVVEGWERLVVSGTPKANQPICIAPGIPHTFWNAANTTELDLGTKRLPEKSWIRPVTIFHRFCLPCAFTLPQTSL